jgi:hypothetical protein
VAAYAHISCRKAVRNLKIFLYKTQVIHHLLPPGRENQNLYCKWLIEKEEDDSHMLDWTFFADEAWFNLAVYVNSQITCLWSTDVPHAHETILPSVKTGLWSAVASCKVMVPSSSQTP